MKFDDVWIKATGSVLGDPVDVPAELAAHTGITTVCRSDLAGPELAVAAARRALVEPGDSVPGLHLHGGIGFPGVDLWSTSCWVANELYGRPIPGLSMSVNALCNTGLGAVEIAATMMAARSDVEHALITVGDRFDDSAVDRFRANSEMILGDAGAAVVLGRGGGLFRLLSCVSYTDPSLEGLQRGDEPFRGASPAAVEPIVLSRRSRQFLTERPASSVVRAHVAGVREVTSRAFAEAGVSVADLRWVATPFVGKGAFQHGYLRPLGLDAERGLFEFGRRCGHLGGADQLVALDHLRSDVRSGDLIGLIGVGGGLSFTCAVLAAA
jgi:3-oxoacyl-[acyl-carrier-protein] synthase III